MGITSESLGVTLTARDRVNGRSHATRHAGLRRSIAFAVVCTSVLACCGTALALDAMTVVRGTVVDKTGDAVAEAKIQVNRFEGQRIDFKLLVTTTDAEGRFELNIPLDESKPLILKEFWAEKPGFVRSTKTGRYTLKPADEQTFDFVLQPGEVLKGTVDKPLSATELRSGIKPAGVQYFLNIRGKDYQQYQQTEKGGAFEVYVPKGEYSIEVLGTTIKAEKILSGSEKIVLKPAEVVVTKAVLEEAFDALWKDMDLHYSYFAYKPAVDWKQLSEKYRSDAVAARTRDQFLNTLKQMLSELEDMHIWIENGSEIIGTHQIPWNSNWNPRVFQTAIRNPVKCGNFAIVGTSVPDGYGVLLINNQSAATPEAVKQTVSAIQKLHDVPGFVVDLRGGCSGGSEPFAQQVAQAFCAEAVVYAKHKYRAGESHDAFGEVRQRVLQPGERPFTKPVVCLIGKKCMSSGEAFVLMMQALPHAVTIGGTTRGASGNPAKFALPGLNVNVWYSRWVALLPDGNVFEGTGITPDVEATPPFSAFQGDADPIWEKGIEILREKVQ